ncbi:MAG: TetR/AcrR family transcriptional regulator [Treponema sp.]|jgi:AcrR family transcriptional regulator|nr:TetR/AcrR family transcriptional regulator [Treponema sp.]
MGIQERKEREKEARKTLIMRCAKDLVLEQGVEAVSMGDIAKKAELSKATLYLYFPGKEALLRELCDTSAHRFIHHVQARLKPGLSAWEQIQVFWRSYLALYGTSDDLLILLSMRRYITEDFLGIPLTETDLPVPAPSIAATLYTMITAMILQGITEGIFDPTAKPDILTRTVLGLFSCIVENAAKLPKLQRKSQAIIAEMKYVFEILLRGIAREGVDRSLLVLPEQKAE